jgi:hypothetical protein
MCCISCFVREKKTKLCDDSTFAQLIPAHYSHAARPDVDVSYRELCTNVGHIARHETTAFTAQRIQNTATGAPIDFRRPLTHSLTHSPLGGYEQFWHRQSIQIDVDDFQRNVSITQRSYGSLVVDRFATRCTTNTQYIASRNYQIVDVCCY